MTKEYKVPQETKELFREASAAQVCRDEAISSVFKAKRAIFYEKLRARKVNEAWNHVRELYPKLRDIQYDHNKEIITVMKAESKSDKTD